MCWYGLLYLSAPSGDVSRVPLYHSQSHEVVKDVSPNPKGTCRFVYASHLGDVQSLTELSFLSMGKPPTPNDRLYVDFLDC